MTTMTTRTFPLDDLLVCGNCQGRISLEHNPQPRYICENSCTAAFKASELNRLLIPEITAVVVTDATYPLLKASFIRALTETTNLDTAPSDDEIRRLIIDPDTFLAEDAVSAAAELLTTFIERVELRTDRATIQYALALPAGSPLAGALRQEMELPDTIRV